ncbi:MAG: UDP-N-acetylmuramate--L-alanine ligase, partial [Clostridia bacterium]|nr:UDP-N-acetylmuramate--L-alanine ligase [Clostridia bacterium]
MSLQNTRKNGAELERLLGTARRIFFIGIGGVHMSSLARWARAQGYLVAGSDRTASPLTAALADEGIRVFIGHDATHIEGADAVVYTLAIEGENPEYRQALARGIPCLSRADFLGWLMLRYPVRIGISGAHGKSTVTAMLAEIFSAAGRSPTVFCGAPMPPDGSPLRMGGGDVCIFEACEYGNSFLCFSPTLAVVLNIAHDHADFFPSLEAVQTSFSRFAASVGATGAVLFNSEDANSAAALEGLAVSRHGFGEGGEFRAENIALSEGFPCFDLVANGRSLGRITLQVLGRHNLQNALAAAGAAHLAGIPDEAIVRGLCCFRGAARRLSLRGSWQGARVFEDYAHHPDEIAAALSALRESIGGQGRLFAVFQSH